MESTTPESFVCADSSGNAVAEGLDEENNLENTKVNNLNATGGRNKYSVYKERNVVKRPCRFYMNHSYCRYGRNCRFSHDRSDFMDNRNSQLKHMVSLSEFNKTEDSKKINTVRLRNEPEIGVKNKMEKSTERAGRQCPYNPSSINNNPQEYNENVAWQDSDIPTDLLNTHKSVQSHQSGAIGRQKSLVFYRSNRGPNKCRYFLRGFCRQGDKCKFVHQANNTSNTLETTETKTFKESFEKRTNEVRNNSKLPNSLGVSVSGRLAELQDLDENEIIRLRNTEIQQFKKRFPAHEVIKSSPEETFRVTVSPSDPDWSFAVNSVSLEIAFTTGYPREACTVKVLEANNLPPILVRHLNNSISDWIKERHESCLAAGKIELLFRPFLRWLDRNLEELFIVGLRKVKQDLLAKEAGIEFVPYDELPGATSVALGEFHDVEAAKHTKKDKQGDCLNSPEESDDIDDKEQSTESINVKHMQGVDQKTAICSTVQEKEITLISELQADYLSTNAENENFSPDLNDLQFTANRENDSLLVSGSSACEKLSIPKVGTEVKFLGLELTEAAAGMVCTKVAATLQCSRCKTRHEINTPPKRTNSLNCSKCHHLMQITFQSAMLHQFSTVMGYLHLVDCQAVDIPLMECSFYVDCLNCSRQISIDGIHYGQQRITWCLYCNKKMSIYMQSVKFQHLQPASNIATTGHRLTTAVKKDKKVIKDPAIQEGKPLPDCGTCRHYKKSYRWLRFPCCGKAYACDICHDEKEIDHEMKYANHMICGFCAKEQPYAGNKPCISCSSDMTKKAGSHWEGGKGCRDKITMSREDRQKYTGIGKTISRKAQSQKQPKKK